MHTLLRWTSPLGIGLVCLAVSLAASSSRAADGTSASAPLPAGRLPAAIAGGEKYVLRYQFRVGEEVRSQVKNLATIETTISGSSQTTEMVSLSHKLWRITSVDENGNVTFEHLIESVDMRNQMTGREEVRYNSVTDKAAAARLRRCRQNAGQAADGRDDRPVGQRAEARRTPTHQLGQ